jgi:3-oxoacyl-[acyl-carrier-protein] synthase II
MGLLRQTLLKRLNESSNDAPDQAVRPFDSEAQGTVTGEGGGLLILEELERAKQRGAKIYAELLGFAASQDTYRVDQPQPDGHSYGKAITNALADAKTAVTEVDLLVPAGLGISFHDRAELAGLATALGPHLQKIALSPIKAQTGSLAAGSGVDAATAVLALHHRKIPPAVNTRNPLDGARLNVSATTRDAELKVSMASTFSLGGQNAALVFRKVFE